MRTMLLTFALGVSIVVLAQLRFAQPAASLAPEPTLTPTSTATLTATPSPSPTSTPTTTATFTPTSTPQPAATPAPPVSEVAAAVRLPRSTPVPGGTRLPLPDGTSVVWGGCASDGECHWYNFYWAPTREVVMQQGEGNDKVQHEYCHAHQHWAISGGAPLRPSDYDLESWYATTEGRSFTTAVAGLGWPWSHSAVNGLEDFAWTCAYWYLDPARLLDTSPERYRWAQQHLP